MTLNIGAKYRHQRSDRKKRENTLFTCINDLLTKYVNCVSHDMYWKLYCIKTVKSIPSYITYRSIHRTELSTSKHDRSTFISANTNLWVGTFHYSGETNPYFVLLPGEMIFLGGFCEVCAFSSFPSHLLNSHPLLSNICWESVSQEQLQTMGISEVWAFSGKYEIERGLKE